MKIKQAMNMTYNNTVPSYHRAEDEPKKIRVLLADDHAVVREGFKLLLEREPGITVVAEARTGEEAVQLASTFLPDVILMDISMPDLNGLQSARTILTRQPKMKIIILSMSDNEEFIQHSLRIGIHGYLLKENASQEIIRAVKEVVLNDNPSYGPAIQKKVFSRLQKNRATESPGKSSIDGVDLTPRELEVLQLVAESKTNAEIAKMLFISDKTVQKHRQQLMDKLDIHDAIGLARWAIHKGISKV
jgi:DNA-binding NarL/FixJ family response regulator